MQKPQFVNNHIYHIYNRGVEKRNVFIEDKNYLRFIHDLCEFNDTASAIPSNVKFSLRNPSQIDSTNLEHCLEVEPLNSEKRKTKKPLVEILAFCLMPNHYHLLVRQFVDNGVVKFMQKLGTGYTMYFNQKYERVGPLFQGRFKAVLLERDGHLLHLPYYIHLNPVELIEPKWKDRKIRNLKKVTRFLESYRWSSYPDYIGKKNFPSVTSREFLTDIVGDTKEYKKATEEWLKDMDIVTIQKVILE